LCGLSDSSETLDAVVRLLAEDDRLPIRWRPHKLQGDWDGVWECRIGPDGLLIYGFAETTLTLRLTGAHADLLWSELVRQTISQAALRSRSPPGARLPKVSAFAHAGHMMPRAPIEERATASFPNA
jgi:mRNA interferase YafQ